MVKLPYAIPLVTLSVDEMNLIRVAAFENSRTLSWLLYHQLKNCNDWNVIYGTLNTTFMYLMNPTNSIPNNESLLKLKESMQTFLVKTREWLLEVQEMYETRENEFHNVAHDRVLQMEQNENKLMTALGDFLKICHELLQ